MDLEKTYECEFAVLCKSSAKDCQKGSCHRFPLGGLEPQTEDEFENEFAKKLKDGKPIQTFEERRRGFGETWETYKQYWQKEWGHQDEYGNKMIDGNGVDLFEPIDE